MNDKDLDDTLARFFDAARRAEPEPPADLTARILADAARVQADRAGAVRRPARRPARRPPQAPVWRQLFSALGGAPALGGFAAACAAGIWLGVSPPQGFDPLSLFTEDVSLYSATYLQDALLTEEGL